MHGQTTVARILRTLRQPADQRRAGRRHGRRPRRAPQGSDAASLQAGDAVRRQVPHHRFRAVELRQFRHPPDLSDDAVQGSVADSARAARLELPARRVRRVHRCGAGTAAGRHALVSRHRRLRLPEPRSDPRAAAQARAGAGRRPHLQDGLRSDDRLSRREGRRHHGRRGRGAASITRAISACCRSPSTTASPNFQEKPQQPEGIPGRPGRRAGLDGHLYLQRPAAREAADRRCRRRQVGSTISART